MRPRLAAVLLLLMLSGVFLMTLPQSSAASPFTVRVARTLQITPYYTHVTDSLYINNTSGSSVGYVDFKITPAEYHSLYSMSAHDATGRALQVELQGAPTRNFTYYRLWMASPISTGSTGWVTINRYEMFFGSNFTQSGSSASLSVSISPTILLLQPILKANFTALLPQKTTSFDFTPSSYLLDNVTFKFTKNTSANTIEGNLTDVKEPDSLEAVTITFNTDPGSVGASDFIYVSSADTRIDLGDSSTVSETMTIVNARGNDTAAVGHTNSLVFVLPSYVDQTSPTASDFSGSLTGISVLQTGNGPVNVTVPLRYDMKANETYSLTLSYSIKSGSVLTRSGDKYSFNLTGIGTQIPFVLNERVRLYTPYGGSNLQTVQTPSAKGNDGGSDWVEFDYVNSSLLASQSMQVSFNYAWYWSLIKPWLYLNLLWIGGVVFVALWLRQKPMAEAVAPVIMSDVKQFCDLYDEKIARIAEARELEESLRRGKIAKPIYDRRMAEVNSATATLDRQLDELRRILKQATPKYSRNLDQIELLEAELRTVNATVRDLQKQYVDRKVSRRVYDDLMYTYEGRQRKIQGRIDSIVLGLREGR